MSRHKDTITLDLFAPAPAVQTAVAAAQAHPAPVLAAPEPITSEPGYSFVPSPDDVPVDWLAPIQHLTTQDKRWGEDVANHLSLYVPTYATGNVIDQWAEQLARLVCYLRMNIVGGTLIDPTRPIT